MIQFTNLTRLGWVFSLFFLAQAIAHVCPKQSVLRVKNDKGAIVESCVKRISQCSNLASMDLASNLGPNGECQELHGKTHYKNPDQSELVLNYKDGKLNGTSYSYSPKKTLISEENYLENRKEGQQKSFYEDGKKKSLESYSSGVKVGEHLNWYPNGELQRKANYTEGRPSGTWTYWYADGKKRTESFYGRLGWEGLYRDWYSNGKLHLSAQYVNGQLEGTYTLYYPNGKKLSERRYSKGILEGLFEEWNSTGSLIAVSEYSKGRFSKWLKEPTEFSDESKRDISSIHAHEPCLNPQSKSGQKCLELDLDGNGYLDYVVSSPDQPKQSSVVLMLRGKVLKELIITEPLLELYSARSQEGQFGEPPTPRDGLVVWGKGQQTHLYLYDFDKEEFEETQYQSDLDF